MLKGIIVRYAKQSKIITNLKNKQNWSALTETLKNNRLIEATQT